MLYLQHLQDSGSDLQFAVVLRRNPLSGDVEQEQAEAARAGFPLADDEHPAPHCLSCGIGERTLGVHAGPLDDGRWASPLRFPDWSLVDDRRVDDGLVWMAMDCAMWWTRA